MKRLVLAIAASAIGASPLISQQQPDYNIRVAVAMAPHGRYQQPICPLKGGDFRTSSAGLYLKTSAEGVQDDNKGGGRSEIDSKKYTDLVRKAISVATEAATANPNSSAAWYYLGRADLQLGDIVGADTSFAKAEKLAPDCAEEIKGFRQRAWIALVTPSADFMKDKQYDSALAVLRAANRIAQYYPQGFYNMAGTFANTGKFDSAMYYFKIAIDKSGDDPQAANTLKSATYNLAVLYTQAGDNTDAVTMWRKYLAMDPDNQDAKHSLAAVLRLTGNNDEAANLEGQLMASGALSTRDLMGVGIRSFTDKNYPAAADAFQKVLATEPYNHDALYDLANAYLAMGDGPKLAEVSQKLVDADPLSSNNLKLLANAYRLQNNQAKQIEITTALIGMPTFVSIDTFRLTKTGVHLAGKVTGNPEGAQTASGKVIPPAPTTLVFEFVNAQGAVVGTQEANIPALQANATAAITVDATGEGIVGWRYHVKK